jgi:hypothetical protein
MAWTHPITPIVVKFAGQKGFSVATGIRPRSRLLRKPELDAVPSPLVDDRDMQAVVSLPLMAKPSDIDGIREHVVYVASTDQSAAYRSARSNNSNR